MLLRSALACKRARQRDEHRSASQKVPQLNIFMWIACCFCAWASPGAGLGCLLEEASQCNCGSSTLAGIDAHLGLPLIGVEPVLCQSRCETLRRACLLVAVGSESAYASSI